MQVAGHDFERLALEYRVLMCGYGRAQMRCSKQLRAQAREIDRLQAQAMRLRAEVIVRETALAWARDDHAALEQAIPGLPTRVTLARRVDALLARIQGLMRELPPAPPPGGFQACAAATSAEPDALEASLRAADLVICQTGCLSHRAYWRVQDHCKRTGKACVLLERPGAVRIVRIHAAADGGTARVATLQAPSST